MSRRLTSDELADLLGAYALDAVDADERVQIEEWLERSPSARREADALREAASMLAESGAEAPADLWAGIEERLGAPPPPLRLAPAAASDRPTRAPSRRAWVMAGIAAAAVIALVVVFGTLMSRNSDQDARLDQMASGLQRDGMRQAALSAAMEPGARTATLETAAGVAMAKVVTTADGQGYFMASDLPTLPDGRTYQLWALTGTGADDPVLSVGVLGRRPSMRAFNTARATTGFAVTVEDAPGVVTSAEVPMAAGQLN